MTTDGDALFRAICEQPWEDTPRLVYADWLEENGIYNGRKSHEAAVRAAYIRHEVAYARMEKEAVAEHLKLMATAFAGYQDRWSKELPIIPGVKWAWSWDRGFVSVASASARALIDRADQIFAAAPISVLQVNRVTPKTFPSVLACEYLKRVEWFGPDGDIGGDDGVRRIARCKNLRNLTHLILSNVGMTDAGMQFLAEAIVFDRLRTLHFGSNNVTDEGAYALLDSITLNELKEIGWHPNPLTAVAVGALRQRFHDSYTGTPDA
ncbi:MAG: TIGR02996 domain-containing protein [Gemmataceae bacterium]|nr:TIGR02996 domain-containing protein [Gemmataceae bacterium]